MKIKMYQVDAFAESVFAGNPAAICILEEMLPLETMQKIAAENFLPETAFFTKRDGYYDLKWFTPEMEMDLCGHATLASAFIIFTILETTIDTIRFETLSGTLTVTKDNDMIYLDFPSRKPTKDDIDPRLEGFFGYKPLEVHRSRDAMIVFDNESQIINMKPDFDQLAKLKEYQSVIVTAPGTDCDFVSRFFAPGFGINEDPVTGSAHCTLIPYWADKLDKNTLFAKQLSKRSGNLYCENIGKRVKIGGKAVLFMEGEIEI